MGPNITVTLAGRLKPGRGQVRILVAMRRFAAGIPAHSPMSSRQQGDILTTTGSCADPLAAMSHLVPTRTRRCMACARSCLDRPAAPTTTPLRE